MNLYQVWFSDDGRTFVLFGTYGDAGEATAMARNIRLACKVVKVGEIRTTATFESAGWKRT